MNQLSFISRIRSIVQDNNGVRNIPQKTSGKLLDSSRLALVGAGSRRAFCRPEKRIYAGYDISLLMDCSGSMGGSREETASEAVHALWYALRMSGVPVHVYRFAGLFQSVPDRQVKSLGMFRNGNKNLMGETGLCNHDGYALACVRSYALSRNEGTPLILVLSDGHPECGDHYDECKEARQYKLMEEVARSRRSGVEVLAVGIETSAPSRYYGESKSVVIHELSTLYDSILTFLNRALKRG